eukprot:901334-Amphidinium_carterae.1
MAAPSLSALVEFCVGGTLPYATGCCYPVRPVPGELKVAQVAEEGSQAELTPAIPIEVGMALTLRRVCCLVLRVPGDEGGGPGAKDDGADPPEVRSGPREADVCIECKVEQPWDKEFKEAARDLLEG